METRSSELPETSQMRARPVWRRYLRRRDLERAAQAMSSTAPPLGPPTEEEKEDAIEILRDVPEWEAAMNDSMFPETVGVTKLLIAEAERIFVEGSE